MQEYIKHVHYAYCNAHKLSRKMIYIYIVSQKKNAT